MRRWGTRTASPFDECWNLLSASRIRPTRTRFAMLHCQSLHRSFGMDRQRCIDRQHRIDRQRWGHRSVGVAFEACQSLDHSPAPKQRAIPRGRRRTASRRVNGFGLAAYSSVNPCFVVASKSLRDRAGAHHAFIRNHRRTTDARSMPLRLDRRLFRSRYPIFHRNTAFESLASFTRGDRCWSTL